MVYGYYTRTLKKHRTADTVCPACGSKGYMNLEVLCRVDHILFIPMWASKKRVVQHCEVCDQYFRPLPEKENAAAGILRDSSKRWYHFTCLILFLVFMGGTATLIITGNAQEQKEIREDIRDIRKGYIIYYKLPEGEQTTLIVDEVRGDTILVRENRYSTNQHVRQIDEAPNYSDKQRIYLRSDLEKMAAEKRILNIYWDAAHELEYLKQTLPE